MRGDNLTVDLKKKGGKKSAKVQKRNAQGQFQGKKESVKDE